MEIRNLRVLVLAYYFFSLKSDDHNREINHEVYGKQRMARLNFLFAKTRRNLIYLSSFLVRYLDISSNFSIE